MEEKVRNAAALYRAQQGQSVANYRTIYAGFAEKGIAADAIKPRENVFTYNAWRALGRQVRAGEKGVKVFTFAPITAKDEETGERKVTGKRPWSSTVFHISQTDPVITMTRYRFRLVQLVEGRLVATDFDAGDVLAAMEARGFPLTGLNRNRHNRAELQGRPTFKGVCGPMYDGERGGFLVIRYETREANARLGA